MDTGLILHTFLGLLLLAVPGALLYLLDRPLLRTLMVAVARFAGQLLVLSLLCWVLIRQDSVWLCLLWLVAMAVGSGAVILLKARLEVRRFLLPVSAAQLLGCMVIGLYLLFAVLPVRNGLDARWLVPVMALLLSHTVSAQIRGLNAYHSALRADEQQYEFLRGNGVPHLKAVVPFVRRAVQAVLAPAAASLSATALFTMPLLLGGLLLAGVAPINAFAVTLLLTVGCVAASVVSLLLSIWLSDRVLFDAFGKLR